MILKGVTMKNHIFVEKAYRYPEPENLSFPTNCTFREDRGYWTKNETGDVLMLCDDLRLPCSKKCDRETGEDQKGE